MTVWLCVSTFWAPFSRRRQNCTSLAPKVHQFGPIRLQPAPAATPAAPRDRIRAPTGVWIWRQNNYYAIPDEYSTDTSTHSTSLLEPRETCFAFSQDCAVELWVEVMWHVSGAWDKGTCVQRKEKQSFTGLVACTNESHTITTRLTVCRELWYQKLQQHCLLQVPPDYCHAARACSVGGLSLELNQVSHIPELLVSHYCYSWTRFWVSVVPPV